MKNDNVVRMLTGTQAFLVVVGGFVAAAGGVALAQADWLRETPWTLAIFTACLVVPAIIATVWAWNRPTIGRWHTGKIVLLWLTTAIVGYAVNLADLKGWIAYLAVAYLALPLVTLTWSWLSGREMPPNP